MEALIDAACIMGFSRHVARARLANNARQCAFRRNRQASADAKHGYFLRWYSAEAIYQMEKAACDGAFQSSLGGIPTSDRVGSKVEPIGERAASALESP